MSAAVRRALDPALPPLAAGPLAALALGLTNRSFEERTWYLWALLVLAVLAVTLVAGVRRRTRLSTLSVVGVACAVGYAALSYLSLLWADFQGSALVEANRAATYAAVVATLVLLIDTPARRRTTVLLVSGASAVLALTYGVRLWHSAPTDLFFDGRLANPIGYPNGTAAFLLIGLWPLVSTAADPNRAPWLRALAALGAAPLPAAALLTQSRAGVLLLGLGTVVFFVVSPLRVRAVIPAGIALGGAALTYDTLDRPYRSYLEGRLDGVAPAGRVLLGLALAGGAVVLGWALLERTVRTPPVVGRVARVGFLVGVAAALAVGVVEAERRDVPHRVHEYWTTFKQGEDDSGATGSRLLSAAGSNRYDFWRVSLLDLRDHPAQGLGAGNFRWRYILLRRSSELPAHAHGQIWESAAGLGLPGVLLYAGLCLAALVAARRALEPHEWPLGAGVLTALVEWLAHSQEDWLWQTPAAGVLGACLVGCALASTRGATTAAAATAAGEDAPATAPRRRLVRRPGRLLAPVGLVLTLLVALVAVAPALLAARWVDASYAAEPVRAQQLARRAEALAPLSVEPTVALAGAQRRAGDEAGALATMREAAEREPRNFSLWERVSELEQAQGRPAEARAACERARRSAPFVVCTS